MIGPVYKVQLSPEAKEDLRCIFAYISIDSPERAARMVDRLLEAIDSLDQMPRRCGLAPDFIGDAGELRHLIVRPYRIVFEVEERTVTVQAVWHGSRRPINRPSNSA
jgi:addiction module RelE/StbE family toxin